MLYYEYQLLHLLCLDSSDYNISSFPMPGLLTESSTEQCYNVSIVMDDIQEENEYFTVEFNVRDFMGNFLYDASSAVVSIEDDDSKKYSK